jgi:aspartate aminotransferase
MAVAEKMLEFMEKASWIRKMFEEGARLKAIHGWTTSRLQHGQPRRPAAEARHRTQGASAPPCSRVHGQCGLPEVRSAVAARLGPSTGWTSRATIILSAGRRGQERGAQGILNPATR